MMLTYVHRGTEIASPRPRQGRAKAKPRVRQGLVKASSRPRQGATRKKWTTDAPKGSPRSSFWGYLKTILQPRRRFCTFLGQLYIFKQKLEDFEALGTDFRRFSTWFEMPDAPSSAAACAKHLEYIVYDM